MCCWTGEQKCGHEGSLCWKRAGARVVSQPPTPGSHVVGDEPILGSCFRKSKIFCFIFVHRNRRAPGGIQRTDARWFMYGHGDPPRCDHLTRIRVGPLDVAGTEPAPHEPIQIEVRLTCPINRAASIMSRSSATPFRTRSISRLYVVHRIRSGMSGYSRQPDRSQVACTTHRSVVKRLALGSVAKAIDMPGSKVAGTQGHVQLERQPSATPPSGYALHRSQSPPAESKSLAEPRSGY